MTRLQHCYIRRSCPVALDKESRLMSLIMLSTEVTVVFISTFLPVQKLHERPQARCNPNQSFTYAFYFVSCVSPVVSTTIGDLLRLPAVTHLYHRGFCGQGCASIYPQDKLDRSCFVHRNRNEKLTCVCITKQTAAKHLSYPILPYCSAVMSSSNINAALRKL